MTDQTPTPTTPASDPQDASQPSTKDLWGAAYQAKETPAETPPAANQEDAGPDASGLDLLKQAFKPTPDATKGTLNVDALLAIPRELWEPVLDLYGQINDVFSEEGLRVDRSDPEYREIQAALDDPLGNLNDTLLAASSAARKKKKRLAETPTRDLVKDMYSKR